jgi:hypothetical protein
MKTKLRLTLDVEYELNGTDPKYVEHALDSLVFRAVGEGLLTSYSDAEVENYEYRVEEIK